MAVQRKKLMQILSVAVPEPGQSRCAVRKTVEDLGRRHAGYGVNDAHYDSVWVALLWTLEQGLGGVWTPDAEAAWKAIYGCCPLSCAARTGGDGDDGCVSSAREELPHRLA